jgi:chromosome partitioning protein
MTSALIAADWYIVPAFPSGYDLKDLETLTRTIDKVRKQYNPKLTLAGVLLGNYDRTTLLDRQVHVRLQERFTPSLVFSTTIGRSVRYRETTMQRVTIFEHPEGKEAAANYTALVKEMINRGAKGAFGATLNPFPDVKAVELVIGEDSDTVEDLEKYPAVRTTIKEEAARRMTEKSPHPSSDLETAAGGDAEAGRDDVGVMNG